MYDNYITFITDDGFINVFGKLDITYKIKRTGIMHKTYTLYALSNVDKCKYKFYTLKNKQMLEQIRNFCIQAQLKDVDIIDIRLKVKRRLQ